MKKRVPGLIALALLISVAAVKGSTHPQGGGGSGPGSNPGGQGGAEKARWEGIVVRSNKDESTLTVRKRGTTIEKTVQYDSSTKWTSQEHGSKKVNDIDASQVNDNDRVNVRGTLDRNGVLHATLISKRLSP